MCCHWKFTMRVVGRTRRREGGESQHWPCRGTVRHRGISCHHYWQHLNTLLLLWQTEYINFEASYKNIWSDGQHNRTVGRTGRPCAVGRTAADDETKKAKHLTETRSLCSTLQVMWRLYRLDLLTLHHSEPGGPDCRRISLMFSVCETLGWRTCDNVKQQLNCVPTVNSQQSTLYSKPCLYISVAESGSQMMTDKRKVTWKPWSWSCPATRAPPPSPPGRSVWPPVGARSMSSGLLLSREDIFRMAFRFLKK